MTCRYPTALLTLLLAAVPLWGQQPTVRIEPVQLDGPRPLAPQTRAAVLRDYLQAWQTLGNAFRADQPSLLGAAFTGVAHDKLAEAIAEQTALGLHTRYQDRAHDIRIVFYSPEGLSIELTDTVDYDVEIIGADNKPLTTQHQMAHYVAILTPSEVRWMVRILQSGEGGSQP